MSSQTRQVRVVEIRAIVVHVFGQTVDAMLLGRLVRIRVCRTHGFVATQLLPHALSSRGLLEGISAMREPLSETVCGVRDHSKSAETEVILRAGTAGRAKPATDPGTLLRWTHVGAASKRGTS